jgi:hypothetical protein
MPSQRINHEAIKALLDRVIEETQWLASPEGLDRIDDRGIKPAGILRDVVINVLHMANENGIAPRTVLLHAALIFAGECGSDSPEWANLQDIIDLCLKEGNRNNDSAV